MHKHKLLKGTHPNNQLQEDYDNGDLLEIKAIEWFPMNISKQILNGKEYAYMKKYKAIEQGYNVQPAPLNRCDCKPQIERYNLNPNAVKNQISYINQKRGFSFKNIDKICALLECQPGDLIEYVND